MKRRGRTAARNRYRPAVGSLEAQWPLSLIQIDHTLVDVIVVDSETRKPIQRPWLTLAIDVCTRCVAAVDEHMGKGRITILAPAFRKSHALRREWREWLDRLPESTATLGRRAAREGYKRRQLYLGFS
jgi:putative transposase